MYNLIKDILQIFKDTLFPIFCLYCFQEGSNFICNDCRKTIKPYLFNFCINCDKPAPLGLTHTNCKTAYSPDGLTTVFDYKDKRIGKAIILGKYSFIPQIFRELSDVAIPFLKTHQSQKFWENFIIVPLPLTKRRKRWRGFNQTEIISEQLSIGLNLKIEQLLIRIKNTKPQKQLNKESRKQNIKQSFTINPGAITKNKNILLVDDVCTTGATLKEATMVLKRSGANHVWCLAIARD